MSHTPKRPDDHVARSQEPKDIPARRTFMLGALSVLPAAALASSCADVPLTDAQAEADLAQRDEALRLPLCDDHDALVRERIRRRQLVDVHMGFENAHDLPGVMDTFSTHGEMIFNGIPFRDAPSIAAGHVLFGMSDQPGALTNTQVIPLREYHTDDSVLIEGHVVADHVGNVLGFPPTHKRVSLPYSAIYQFDRRGKLVSERIVMNWVPLAVPG